MIIPVCHLDNSECRDTFGIGIIVVLLALVFNWRKVIKDADTIIGKTQIVPQLLTLLCANLCNCLAFYNDMIFNKKIQSMFMRNLMSMEVDKESELGLKRNPRFFKSYLQGILVHVFIQPRSISLCTS